MAQRLAASLAAYVAGVLEQELPEPVQRAAALHVLDTIAAAVSGSCLPAGVRGRALVASSPLGIEASVWGSSLRSTLPLAGLANAMAAHADETDDSHGPSRTHPECSVVPATLAAAEALRASGADVIRAVVVGYDVCSRVPPALWPGSIEQGRERSTHAAGGLFGAAVEVQEVSCGLTSAVCTGEAVLTVLHDHDLEGNDVDDVLAQIPGDRLATVGDRPIADVNIEFLLGVAVDDGAVPFDIVHDSGRFDAWWSAGGCDRRIRVMADDGLPASDVRPLLARLATDRSGSS